jgi:hypothetical protein
MKTKNDGKMATAIKAAIRRRGSNYRVSAEAGIPACVLYPFMSGKSSLSLPYLERLVEYLGFELVARKRERVKDDV